MLLYRRLAEQDRAKRQTAMDALEVLRSQACFQDGDRAEFHIGLMTLSSGDRINLVDLWFDHVAWEVTSIVSLPSSTHFEAHSEDLGARRRLEIARLDGAQIDGHGRVRLSDGSGMRALEVERASLPLGPTGLDWAIVHLTLELIGATDCYRSLRQGSLPQLREMCPTCAFSTSRKFRVCRCRR